MQRGLAVEKYWVSVSELAFHRPPHLQVHLSPHGFEVEPRAVLADDVFNFGALFANHFLDEFKVKSVHVFDDGQRLGHLFRNAHLSHVEHRVAGDDRS